MIRFGTYLLQNSYGIYHFRISVPPDLRPIIRKREIKKSLKTTNLVHARKAAYCYAVNAQVFFEEIRSTVNGGYTHMLSDDDIKRLSLNTPRFEHGGIKINGSEIVIGPAKTDPNNPNDIKDLNAYLDKIKEIFPNAQISVTATPQSNKKAAKSTTPPLLLQDLFNDYIKEKKQIGDWKTGKTEQDYDATFTSTIRILGNVPVEEVDKNLAKHLKDVLFKYPSNVTKKIAYKNLSVPQILNCTIPKKDLITLSTVRKYMSRMSAVFSYAVVHGLADNNPFDGLVPKKQTSKNVKLRDQFISEELRILFSTDIYTDLNFKKPHYYWLPLLGLFTGARISELCQLTLDDIKTENGISYIDINENADDKSVKTSAGIRKVPIHSTIKNLGFDQYIQKLDSAGEKRLFPEITPYSRKKYDYKNWGTNPSKWFTKHLIMLKIKHAKISFHSFRHTMITALDNALVDNKVSFYLTGHDLGRGVHDNYAHGLNLKVLHSEIEKINFDDILDEVKPFHKG